ncbi:MAG: copper chaperone PCu(A)C [Chloroflexota bacterium]|nr:copper chaperone PCu(A)C [Chloroflexota bacterium]
MTSLRQIGCALIFALLLTACRQQRLSSSDIRLDISANDLLVGQSQISVSARDKNGNAIENPGAILLRGDMDHAGMAPVFAESNQAVNGVFSLPFEWTMAGDWILEASLTLDSGEAHTESFRYEIHYPDGDRELPNMDHNGRESHRMEDAERNVMTGESSAVYMQIENSGASAVVIAAAKSAAAHQVEFHRSVVDDDIARMEAVETLVIPAGERLALRPGGLHIMLRQLKTDLKPGSSIDLHLELDTGEMIQLSIPILNMLMDEDPAPTAIGNLVFSKLWARPASAASAQDHEAMTEEPAGST